MLKIDIQTDLSKFKQSLAKEMQKQVSFAASRAINDTLKIAQADVRKEMSSVFANPVSRTLNAVKVRFSNKSSLIGKIFIEDFGGKGIAPAKYLAAEILGGQRHQKRFERALQARGLMGSNMVAVPGPGAPKDGNGNVPGSFIVMLLSYLQAFGEQGYRANMTAKRMKRIHGVVRSPQGFVKIGGVAYFISNGAGRTHHLPPGIYAKTGTHGVNIKPVFLFVSQAKYRAALPFESIIRASFAANFGPRMRARLDEAISSARK